MLPVLLNHESSLGNTLDMMLEKVHTQFRNKTAQIDSQNTSDAKRTSGSGLMLCRVGGRLSLGIRYLDDR